MQQQNPFLAWLQESLQRLFKKSPKFFRIWQMVLGFTVVVTGLPALLTGWGIELPEALTILQNKVIAYISTGAFIMTQLSTQSTVVGVTPQGDILKKTDQKALPFTAQQEEKTAITDATETVVLESNNPVTERNKK